MSALNRNIDELKYISTPNISFGNSLIEFRNQLYSIYEANSHFTENRYIRNEDKLSDPEIYKQCLIIGSPLYCLLEELLIKLSDSQIGDQGFEETLEMTVKKIYYPEQGDTYGEYLDKIDTEGFTHYTLGHLSIPKDHKINYQISYLTQKIQEALDSAINLDHIPELKDQISQQIKTLKIKEDALIRKEDLASLRDNNRLMGQE